MERVERVVPVVVEKERGEWSCGVWAVAAARLRGARVVDVAGIHGPGSPTKFSG